MDGVVVQGHEVGDAARPSSNRTATMELTFGVPRGFAISLVLSGAVIASVGDVGGVLELDLSGSSAVTAGESGPLDADVAGSARAEVRGVRERLECALSGSGSLSVGPCSVGMLDAEVAGGRLLFAGSADRAEVEASSGGVVQIQEVGRSLEVKASKGAKVTVCKAAGCSMEAELSGGSRVTVSGTVHNLEVEASGGSVLDIAEVTGSVEQESGGGSVVNIGKRATGKARRGWLGWF